MPKETLKRALSIRQPLSEWILTGEKTKEYRSRRTLIRGRVYLYAGKKVAFVDDLPENKAEAWQRSVIVGSVAIVGCCESKRYPGYFGWKLANPRRYRLPLKAHGVPQPGFWFPKF